MLALIDADILVFRCGFAAERNQWYLGWDLDGETSTWNNMEVFAYKREAEARLDEVLPGKYSRTEGEDYQLWPERYLEPVENALHNVKEVVNKSLDAVGCTEFDVKCFLSGPKNFRHEVAKTRPYKGNRDEKHRPQHEEAIRNYIRSKWDTTVAEDVEADDLMGMAQCKADGRDGHNSVIITIDKDLDMIPGLKYNFVHDIRYEVPHHMAWTKFCTQLLMGDSTDNIPGLPKVGKAKAAKMLDGIDRADEQLEEVARQYASKSGREDWFDYLKEQADLIWIMRKDGERGSDLIPDYLQELGGSDYSNITAELW